MSSLRIAGILMLVLAGAASADAQVRHVVEMTMEELRRVDREKTVVIIPGGILEQHGPYLPIFSDGYLNEGLARHLADAVVARPGWQALIFPTIPLGNSGANDIGGKFAYPGTYAVRFETLRAIFMDLADELGAQGFRSIFVVHLHGAPNHSRALDAAGDYFAETFGGFMVHLGGIASVFGSIEGAKTTAEEAEDGLPIHAGMDETSWMLFLRADLVGSAYREAPALSGSDMAELVRIAQRDDWPGYFGSPRLATAAHGAAIWERLRTETIDVARRLLDGANPRDLPRFTITMDQSPVDVELDAESLKEEARRAERQQQWLRSTVGRSVTGDR